MSIGCCICYPHTRAYDNELVCEDHYYQLVVNPRKGGMLRPVQRPELDEAKAEIFEGLGGRKWKKN
jgi:hypothetical protein